MPRAEVGSTKHLANAMKSKGLQRLRWWCEPCQKQCRDANGFKCHVQSESHARQMQIVGEDPKKFIEQYSRDFKRDFLQLLRTSHGEKWIGANRFYNEYIAHKEHVHMNATKWPSLTEFTKYLGREGICHVKEDEKDGLMIAWRDVSSQAIQRRAEIKAAEALEARNEAGEDRMLKKMAKRAKEEAEAKAKAAEARKAAEKSRSPDSASAEEKKEEPKADGEEAKPAAPIKISFGLKAKAAPGKPGLAQMKSQSVFKRMRTETGDDKAAKKIKT